MAATKDTEDQVRDYSMLCNNRNLDVLNTQWSKATGSMISPHSDISI